MVDNTRFKRLAILITKPWNKIINCYKAIRQILEKRDNNSTGGTKNNVDSENAHAKAGFSIYNFTNTDIDAGAGDTSGMDNMTKEVSKNIDTGAS